MKALGPRRRQALVYLILVAILVLGGFIRSLSFVTNGPSVLLDLDPFHSLRAVASVMGRGVLPGFDPLSSAPNGTYYTFSTSQGYYGFISSLGLLAGLSPSETLAISPTVFFVLELVEIFAIALAISKSSISALMAAFFAVCLTGWSAISILGGDPVAENLGAVLFLSLIILVVTLELQSSLVVMTLIGFVDGVTLQVHPVAYYFVNFVLAGTAVAFASLREWQKLKAVVLAAIASSYSIILFGVGRAGLSEAGLFSRSAFWLASTSRIYTIDNSVLITEIGIVTLVLAGVSIIIILLHMVRSHFILVAWAATLFPVVWVGEFAVFSPYGNLVENLPFSAPLVLSHRIMPYLPPVLCILAAVAVGEFILPPASNLAKRMGIANWKIGALVILVVLSISSLQLSRAYEFAMNYSSTYDVEPAYSGLYNWINSHTSNNSNFIVNDVGLGVYVKAIDHRPVFFTTSQEDLTVRDLNQRALVQTCLFLPICDVNSTEDLISSYHIDYAIVVTPALMVDENSSSFFRFNDNPSMFVTYLTWFQTRPNFLQVYNDSDSAIFSL